MTDATLLCDLLDITSEDIIERFEDMLVERMDILREVFDIDLELVYNYNSDLDGQEETEDDYGYEE